MRRVIALIALTLVASAPAAAHEWHTLAPAQLKRTEVSAVRIGDAIYVAGGEEPAGTIPEVELLNPRTRRWSRLDRMPRPRHGLGVVACGRTVYTVQGGVKPGFSFSAAIESLRID